LSYRVVSDAALKLIWSMKLRASCGMVFTVEVDGITGQAGGIATEPTTELDDRALRGFRPRSQDDIFSACRFRGTL